MTDIFMYSDIALPLYDGKENGYTKYEPVCRDAESRIWSSVCDPHRYVRWSGTGVFYDAAGKQFISFGFQKVYG